MTKKPDVLSRCQRIYAHPLYKKHFQNLQKFEEDRIFCRHTFEHFMDVARIAYIMNLEKGLGLSKEIIYAVALLHDIGRDEQYENDIPHEIAGAKIAESLLPECGFDDREKSMIVGAILEHRSGNKHGGDCSKTEGESVINESCGNDSSERCFKAVNDDIKTLSNIIFTADKASRQCFSCIAQNECNWSMDKRNLEISI